MLWERKLRFVTRLNAPKTRNTQGRRPYLLSLLPPTQYYKRVTEGACVRSMQNHKEICFCRDKRTSCMLNARYSVYLLGEGWIYSESKYFVPSSNIFYTDFSPLMDATCKENGK